MEGNNLFFIFNQRIRPEKRLNKINTLIMQILIKIIFISLVSLSFISCDKENKEADVFAENDYLIFGKFHGFCHGETCIETFQIKANSLYEDTKDNYRSFDDFDFVALSVDKYKKVKDITDHIPSQLWNEPNEKVFGCPDCYDQGGYIVQQRKQGTIRSWILDSNPNDVPEYLHDFMQKIHDSIILINE